MYLKGASAARGFCRCRAGRSPSRTLNSSLVRSEYSLIPSQWLEWSLFYCTMYATFALNTPSRCWYSAPL